MVNHDQPDENSAPAAIPALTPQGASRRRLAGLGVSGVLMTVASTNAMADLVCRSPSGALSGDLHASHAVDQTCSGGRSPAWWAAHQNLWPAGITAKTRFQEVFFTTAKVGQTRIDKLLEERGNKSQDTVPALMMATYLNVTASPPLINYLTKDTVLAMWNNYDQHGGYQHSGGKVWDSYEFAQYLRNTQLP